MLAGLSWVRVVALVCATGVCSASLLAEAQTCSDGTDGTPALTASGSVNTYYPGPSTGSTVALVGARSIAVEAAGATGDGPPVGAGDLLLIVQMQGAEIDSGGEGTVDGDYGDGPMGLDRQGQLATRAYIAGRYEFNRAAGPIAADSLPLVNALETSFVNDRTVVANGDGTGQGFRTYQVIRVPEYAGVTIPSGIDVRAEPWNGRTGGVVALDVAGTLAVNGTIEASGRGYRGGSPVIPTVVNDTQSGVKGEGIGGTPTRTISDALGLVVSGATGYFSTEDERGAPGNAGGTPVRGDSGGGGGGGTGSGGDGAVGPGSGATLLAPNRAKGGAGQSDTARLFMGGGGGSGTLDDPTPVRDVSGQAGGGVVLVRAGTLSGTGSILANGQSGTNQTTEGCGGGGGGGTVLILTESTDLSSLTIEARGGDGSSTNTTNDAGGGGGGGGHVIVSHPGGITVAFSAVVAGGSGGTAPQTNRVADDGADGLGQGLDPAPPGTVCPAGDTDGDGVADPMDLDDDNDGILDSEELSGLDPDTDANDNGIPDWADPNAAGFGTDANGDGVDDAFDLDGDGIPNHHDADSDGDGLWDLVEGNDTDGDGVNDNATVADVDLDGVVDSITDGNTNGVDDSYDTTAASTPDSDGDGADNYLDVDDDGDAVHTRFEAPDANGDGYPDDAQNTDGEGLPDYLDTDDDNDGILTAFEDSDPDMDGDPADARNSDGMDDPDYLDTDDDNDGVLTVFEGPDPDMDGNPTDAQNTDGAGEPDYLDTDDDDDGMPTDTEMPDPNGDGDPADAVDTDLDGTPDYLDLPCATDADCPIENTVCQENGTCGPCLGDADCRDPGMPACGIVTTGECVECTASEASACTGVTPVCDADRETCEVCTEDDAGACASAVVGTACLTDPTEGNRCGCTADAECLVGLCLVTVGRCIGGDTDGDGLDNESDADDDNDGIPDVVEGLGTDYSADANDNDVPDWSEPSIDGFVDDNGDGVDDRADADGDGIPNHLDLDSDSDGILDAEEARPGEGLDADGDGRLDETTDADGDGLVSAADPDDTLDSERGAAFEPDDNDADGIDNYLDIDSDGDGIPDVVEGGSEDSDGDGRLDSPRVDSDGDGLADRLDPTEGGTPAPVPDTDGVPGSDYLDVDSDADGVPDVIEGRGTGGGDLADRMPSGTDSDGDGLDDAFDPDCSVATVCGGVIGVPADVPDTDMDGQPNFRDVDDDGDGVHTEFEAPDPNGDGNPTDARDTDGDGTPDYLDPDDDGDGVPTQDERADPNGDGDPSDAADGNGDGVPDYLDDSSASRPGLAGGALCSSHPGGGSRDLAGLWWALGLFALLRLRRRRPLKKTEKRSRIAFACAALGLLVGANPVQAQQFTLDQYRASERTEDGFAISRPYDQGHLRFGAQVHLDYGNDPLVLERDQGDEDTEEFPVVSDQLVAHAVLSLGLADRVLLFAGLPVNLVMEGDGDLGTFSADGASLGDVFAGARVRLLGTPAEVFGLALQGTVTAPTADAADGDQSFAGESGFSFSPELLLEVGGAVRLTGNIGARLRSDEDIDTVEISHELTYGLGLLVPLVSRDWRLNAHVEAYGTSTFEDFGGREETPIEAIAGLKLHLANGLTAGLAGGPGLQRGLGSPDVRLVAMLGWAMPGQTERKPETPPVPADRDQDGFLDVEDDCPDDPEDGDGFEDGDGCPDPDNDQDGVLDVDDGAPLQPEDVDDYEDLDGVPDPDNDSDGVLDVADECPNESGTIENRGCPDRDRDNDTVVDRVDNCPDEPGEPEYHGCQKPQQVIIQEGRLEILDKVYFRTNRDVIQRRSYPLLRNVAEVLNNHPEIQRVRVEGHTDARGSRDYNMDLSRRRAEAVVEFLVTKGEVEAGRLEAVGFGPDQPIVPEAQSRDEHAQNRRVEFNLLDQGAGIQQQESQAPPDTVDY